MIEKTVTLRVRIGGIIEGNPPMLLYSKIATRPDGKQKLFSQAAKVTDADLLARLRSEVRNGDEVEVVVEQRLSNEGISILLKDCVLINAPARVTS